MRMLPLLLAALAAIGGPARAAVTGFVVFAPAATQRYEPGPDKALHLVASGPAMDPADHVASGGRVFGLNPLGRRIYRLGADLKEDRSSDLGEVRDLGRIVAADDERVYVFFDNTLVGFDRDLKPAVRVILEPRKSGAIVPVISVDLARNTGDVFAVALGARTSVRLPIADDEIRDLWIDPDGRSLNVLVARSREEHTPELDDLEKRVIKTQVVLAFALGDLARPPQETEIYEEREIHKPYPPGFLDSVQRKQEQGIIVDYPPPYRSECPPKGTYVSKTSATTPCFAEVFIRDPKEPVGIGSSELVVLGTGGGFTKLERFRDDKHGVLWFKFGGDVRIIDRHTRAWRLVLQPHAYIKLLDTPGAADAVALAY